MAITADAAVPSQVRGWYAAALGPGEWTNDATMKGHTHSVEAVAVMPDGLRAVSASIDRTLRLWDLESGHDPHARRPHRPGQCCGGGADGLRAVSGSWDGTLGSGTWRADRRSARSKAIQTRSVLWR